MADLKALTQLVINKCPGPVSFIIEDALLKAYREFCRESEYLVKREVIKGVEAGKPVNITPPADHYLLLVQRVYAGGREVKPNDVDYCQPEPGELVFNRDHNEVEVTFSYCPTALITTVSANDDVVNRWGDEIAAGAAAELRKMPGKDWTEPALYDLYRRDFVEAWRAAKRQRQEQFNQFNNHRIKRTFY